MLMGRAAWLLVVAAGLAFVAVPVSAAQVRLTVTAGGTGVVPWQFCAGIDDAAQDGFDENDAPSPPAPPFAEIRLTSAVAPHGLMIDQRDGGGGSEVWPSLSVRAYNVAPSWTATVVIGWDLASGGGWKYVLHDITNSADVTLAPGGSYSFQMTGETGPQMSLEALPWATTTAASKAQADGSRVAVDGVVAGKFPVAGPQQSLYVESEDRSSGIQIAAATAIQVGDRVHVSGVMATADGERRIEDAQVRIDQAGGDELDPVGVTNRALGGRQFGLQAAVLDDAVSLDYSDATNNVGLLVTTTGRLTYAGPGGSFFYIDDGSGLDDGSGHTGARVQSADLTIPTGTPFLRVTGNAGTTLVESRVVRLLKPRAQADIVVVAERGGGR